MYYRGGRGVVPPDDNTSTRNCGDAYDGIRPGRMIVKFRGWPRDMVMQMRLWHIGVAEPPCEGHALPCQMALEHLSMSYRRGRPRKSMTCQGSFASHDIVCRQVVQYGGAHSAALRSALLPFPASSLPRELVSGRHLPLSEAVGWPRPPYRTAWRTTCR